MGCEEAVDKAGLGLGKKSIVKVFANGFFIKSIIIEIIL